MAKILLVDDVIHFDFFKAFKGSIERAGHQVIWNHWTNRDNPRIKDQDPLAYILRCNVDITLLHFSSYFSLQKARELLAKLKHHKIRVIIIANFMGSLMYGNVPSVQKPFETSQLLNLIEDLMEES